jgi:hypothetical protein
MQSKHKIIVKTTETVKIKEMITSKNRPMKSADTLMPWLIDFRPFCAKY